MKTAQFFYIVDESEYGVWYVSAEENRRGVLRYASKCKTPTLFNSRAAAEAIIADYQRISRNAGKTPTPLTIREASL